MSNASTPPPPPDSTLAPRAPGSSGSQRTSIDKVCVLGGTPGQFRGEFKVLLRNRLQLAALITLFPVAIFLFRNVLQNPSASPVTSVGVVLQLLSFVINAALAALLWSRFEFSLRTLRLIELSLFGLFVVYFSWVQFDYAFVDVIKVLSLHGRESDVHRLLSLGQSVRWFFLIIVYGVFIPNTWQRCSLVVGATALLPALVTGVTTLVTRQFDADIATALFDMEVVLITACLIAVFGSYRFHVLQTQAFEAEELGRYKLKRKLGSGGMGDVYLAEHVLLHRPCAVKLIRRDQAGDAQNLERFEREVRAMAQLTHWNTVEIFDYGHAADGTFYYVMEYLPGVNLEVLVNRYGPLPAERAVHLLRQMCRALREAHQIGLLHRDIKPSNVIACERGGIQDVVKLLDFGLVQSSKLSNSTPKLTIQGTIVGSPPYLSPEQALGKKNLDGRSDIYGVGAVAYFLLTGQPPFPRETAMQMLLAHAYEPATPLHEVRADIPADVEEVVMRCLRKNPEDRFPDVRALGRAFAACKVAGLWTEEMAAQWWKDRPLPTHDTMELPQPTVIGAF